MSILLQNELTHLKNRLLTLGAAVEDDLVQAAYAVEARDTRGAETVITREHEIDAAEVRLEEECLKLLALYQPVAMDLRFIVAILKMNNDLERIADLAVHIAEQALLLAAQPPVPVPAGLSQMAARVRANLKQSLDAFVHLNAEQARAVCAADAVVDALYHQVNHWAIREITGAPAQITCLMAFISVARHLERAGDHATNIAEDILYMLQGDIVRHQPLS